jgi:hypothetical protein
LPFATVPLSATELTERAGLFCDRGFDAALLAFFFFMSVFVNCARKA